MGSPVKATRAPVSAPAPPPPPPPAPTPVAPKKTPGFAESFWTPDYAGGLGQLFAKLNQGVVESQQILAIARMRADAEDAYGLKLLEITPAVEKPQGFARDDGASVRKAYEGIKVEMVEAGKSHRKIAANIRELVVNPFSKWCTQHEGRVNGSHDDLQSRLKAYERQLESVRKLKSVYFNKCRLLEDAKEESQLAFQDPLESPQGAVQNGIPEIKEVEADDDELYELGDVAYDKDQVKKILQHMMTTVRMANVKYPILGTYQNVSTGADITDYIQRHLGAGSVSYAERIGQSMLDLGFLRLVGQVGKTFANSSRINFKWQSKAFDTAGIIERGRGNQGLLRSLTVRSDDGGDSPIGAMGDYLSNWKSLANQHPNETTADKLRREAREGDQRYKAAVRKLDELRCTLEEQMIDHLRWQERLELERLSAVKTVILDFSGAISNVIPGMQSTIDSMMIFQESIQPAADLRYMIESYRSGGYAPKVTTYENYTRHTDDQVFGVDVEARAKADGRRVPLIVSTILQHMDEAYPQLEGDTARQAVWKIDVPLEATHHLRNVLNTRPVGAAILMKYELPIVASVLKLYLLEAEPLVPSSYYDIIKAIYASESAQAADPQRRISILQSTLCQLKLVRIATLDALCTHFERFLSLTSASEPYTVALATGLAACILRPRVYTNMTFEDKHPYLLVRDLLANRHAIFSELKRLASQTHNAAGSPIGQLAAFKLGNGGSTSGIGSGDVLGGGSSRVRADSSNDESGRKAAVEARNRAISLNAHKKDLANAGTNPLTPSGLASSASSVTSNAPTTTTTDTTTTTTTTAASERTLGSGGSTIQAFSSPRSRASSPLPAGLSVRVGNAPHRRERSVGGGEGRFPVIASPGSPPIVGGGGAAGAGAVRGIIDAAAAATVGTDGTEGRVAQMGTPVIGVVAPSPVEPDGPVGGSKVGEIGKRFESLPVRSAEGPAKGPGLGHVRGVTLEDRPWLDD